MRWQIEPGVLNGQTSVPGDKSIGHRALLVASLADGESGIRGLPDGADVRSTRRCLESLGVHISSEGAEIHVFGNGSYTEPQAPLDAGNSGTTMRLLSGILAGQSFSSTLVGDASLSRRPMRRIIEPLSLMGAEIGSHEEHAPLHVTGRPLHGISYHLPVASAQVKSAIMFAGLLASGETRITEPALTRDHSERMLSAAGVALFREDHSVRLAGRQQPMPINLTVPGDISSAAFLWSAAVLTGGCVTVKRVGINPTRDRILDVLRRMGGEVAIQNASEEMGEPIADVTVSGHVRRPIEVSGDEVAFLIDELPLVALLATQAPGVTEIRDAQELRVKETDRIATAHEALRALGARVETLPDGLRIHGPTPLKGGIVNSHGDHRLAMLGAIAGLCADGNTIVEEAEAAVVSFPGFGQTVNDLGGSIHAV